MSRKPSENGSRSSCPDEPETSTPFFESEGALRSMLFMNSLREQRKLCDVTLLVNGASFPAHQLVLAACSSYFAEVFAGDAKFGNKQSLDLTSDDVDEESLTMLLDFAYTKRVNINQVNVHKIFNAADCLRFQGLKVACFRYLMRTLDVDNCLGMWTFACAHEGDKGGLEEAAYDMVKKNFKDILLSDTFLALSVDDILTVLRSDDLAVEKEEQVYEAAVRWLEHDDQRLKCVPAVLACIRLPLIDLDYLMDTVQENELVRSHQKSLDDLIKAIDFKQKELEAGRSPRGTLLTISNADEEGDDGLYATVGPRRPSMLMEEVRITKKRSDRLGLSVMGGLDRPGHVFRKGDRPGCLVNGILEGGAAKGSPLRVGDRILSVNGHNLETATHDQAIAFLTKTRETLVLVVRHEEPPAGLKEFTLKTNHGEGFGFSIGGGMNSPPANPANSEDDGVFVTRVLTGGAAAKSGLVKAGQRLLQVNSISMHGSTHAEALQATRQSVDRLTLMVCDGFTEDTYLTLQDYAGAEKDHKRRSIVTRKSMIFDPSAYVTF